MKSIYKIINHPKLSKLHTPAWLAVFLAILFILRIPSLFEPFSYGDEMIYLTLGEAIRRGMVLYRDIHDNKPPLLYLLAAVSGNIFWFRGILAVWMLATTYLFWRLSETLFPKMKRMQQVATITFGLLTTLPLLEGHVANAELFMVGPTIAALLILFKWKSSPRNLLLSGLLFSVATLFKVPAIFDIPVVFVFWLIASTKGAKDYKEIIKRAFFVGVGFLTPILLTFIWYAYRGALNEYGVAAFLQNVGYLSSFRPDDAQKNFFVRNAPLLIRAGLVLLICFKVFLFRKRLSKAFILSVVWLAFSLFAVTLSERPYPHYLIQSVPAISLLIAILVSSPKIEQVYAIAPLGLAIFVPIYFKFYYYSTFDYYSRFVRLASGQTTQKQYFDKFDGNVWRNYKIAEFLKATTKPTDPVFVWGDSPPIYALSRRLPQYKYIAQYHIYDFSNEAELMTSLIANPPAFIVVLPNNNYPAGLSEFLNSSYTVIGNIEGARVWRLLSDEVIQIIKK